MIFAGIPARSGSKGVRDKNIIDLGGKPLLAWSIETAKQIPEVSRVIVSTDSPRYAEIAMEYGADVPFLRPEAFAQDDSPDYDWINHLLENLRVKPDLLLHLRPTTPLRYPQLVRNAICSFLAHNEATSLRSVHEMGETAWKCFEVVGKGKFLKCLAYYLPIKNPEDKLLKSIYGILPRQLYPKTYHPNGYVDILRVEHIVKHKELCGNKILAFETPRVVEIDTPEDLEYLRWQIGRMYNSKT